jgi:hypothetical protein
VVSKAEREAYDSFMKTQQPRIDAEERAVRELGDAIGYGRLMQCAEKVWRDINRERNMEGAEHTTGPCASMMVRCPHTVDKFKGWLDRNGHCDWCCGAGRVTERVAKAMRDFRKSTEST